MWGPGPLFPLHSGLPALRKASLESPFKSQPLQPLFLRGDFTACCLLDQGVRCLPPLC